MKYYVYGLIDPRTNEPFYIGKGTGNRVDAHEAEARSGKYSHKCNYIRLLWNEGFEVRKVCYKAFRSERSAYAYEKKLIAEYGLERLTNINPGGQIPILSDPEEASDRGLFEALCVICRKTEGFNVLKRWYFLGEWRWPPTDFLDKSKQRFNALVHKRGMEWATKIASRNRINLVCETN